MLSRTPFLRGKAIDNLQSIIRGKLPEYATQITTLKKEYGATKLSDSTVDTSYGGMRGVTSLIYEPSLLDPQEGIRFRGLSIPECQAALPKWKNGTEMMPEAIFYLLLTGDVPTAQQTEDLRVELAQRATSNPQLMKEVTAVINTFPEGMHPMDQFCAAIHVLGKNSLFAQAYSKGVKKSEYWVSTLEDSLDCIARITYACALIYRRTFKGSSDVAPHDANLDWTGNFMNQMGFTSAEFHDCMRMYLSIHTDHEGGNVSAHTTVLVGSALSNPYLSFAAGMCGLAGPLHGLANQEVLGFLKSAQVDLEKKGVDLVNGSDEAIKKSITEYSWELLKSGRVIPGYGHAVLRKTDPRFTAQNEFARKNFPNDPLFRLVNLMYAVVPDVLTEQGKVKNPFPNVDAHSGCLLQHYGMKDENFYTVLFGVSRALGVLSALVWERALMKPIERPKSITTEALFKQVTGKK